MIILPLVFLFWMAAHNQADDLCRPTIDGVPTLLCPSHSPLGFPRGGSHSGAWPVLLTPPALDLQAGRHAERRAEALLWP